MSVGCGGAVSYRRRYLPCWGLCDGARRTVVAWYSSSPYYAPVYCCCYCGDTWSDGELGSRPFVRGWRKKAIARHWHLWSLAGMGRVARDRDLYVVPDDKEVRS